MALKYRFRHLLFARGRGNNQKRISSTALIGNAYHLTAKLYNQCYNPTQRMTASFIMGHNMEAFLIIIDQQ